MIEQLILNNLVYNEEYVRKSLPFLKSEYFTDKNERIVFELIRTYIDQYNRAPNKEALIVDLSNMDNITQDQFSEIEKYISNFNELERKEDDWLVDKTEKFCQDKAIYNAIMTSIRILDDKTGHLSKGSIPKILQEALGVSFDTNIGHDFLDDAEKRFDFYHRKDVRLPFDLEYMNLITEGGLPKKTLNIILAGPYVGKSLFMCHCAANNLNTGKNVLYITMELAEERIAQRIDANLMGVSVNEIKDLPKDVYDKKISRIKNKTQGKLIIKEYPTATAGSANFRHLLNELRLKKNFTPDIIYIDYLNICISSRLKLGSNINTYSYIKAIAEELRGLAVEFDLPIVSATQTNRCLALDTIVYKEDGHEEEIQNLIVGDKILSSSGYVQVKKIYPIEKQKMYEIVTKSGKVIKCSGKHLFPTASGVSSLESGLSVGDSFFVKD
jgi:archaellum biogenesis ATPase FlaH